MVCIEIEAISSSTSQTFDYSSETLSTPASTKYLYPASSIVGMHLNVNKYSDTTKKVGAERLVIHLANKTFLEASVIAGTKDYAAGSEAIHNFYLIIRKMIIEHVSAEVSLPSCVSVKIGFSQNS